MPAERDVALLDGQPLAGRHILVHNEQGLGDQIMFASALAPVIAEAEKTTLVVSGELVGLFQASFPTARVLPTRVGRGATIGANATIVCGHEIGAYAFIGAGAVVTANVPPFALVFGVPARQVGWMCRCGVRLVIEHGAGWCSACGRGYRAEGDGIAEA